MPKKKAVAKKAVAKKAVAKKAVAKKAVAKKAVAKKAVAKKAVAKKAVAKKAVAKKAVAKKKIIIAQPTMTEDEWQEKYKPIPNHIDLNASWQNENNVGTMFETYGPELDFVFAADPHKVWTYVEGDYGTYLINGRAIVNRIGYFVCEVPWKEGEFFEITIQDDRLCPDCDELPETCICGSECPCKDKDEDDD